MTSVIPEHLTGGDLLVTGPVGAGADRARKHVLVREYVRGLAVGLAAGTAMPSERELVARFGVARMTVRQAIDGLVADGLLDRVPGRGTFVAHHRDRPAGGPRSLTEELRARGMVVDSRTLRAAAGPATPGVARALELAPGEVVWHWRRLRLADARPIAIDDAWFAARTLPGFDAEVPPSSLYDALGARGLRPTSAEDTVSAELVALADARQLGITRADPVLRVVRRCRTAGRPVAVGRILLRSDRYAHRVRSADDF